METRAHHLLIGSFTLAVVVAGFLFVLWIGKLEIDRRFAYYDIAFDQSVSGLSVTADVRYQGIPVGEVTRIWIDPNQPDRVRVTIAVEHRDDIRIRENTVATLEYQGVTGVAIIQLETGPPVDENGNPVPELKAVFDPLGDLPRIPSRRSGLDSIFASFPKLLERTEEVLVEVRDLLRDNRDSVGKTLENVEAITRVIRDQEDEIRKLLADAAKISGDLSASTGDIKELVGELRSLSTTAKTVLESDVVKTLDSVAFAASSIGVLAEDGSRLIQSNEEAVEAFTSQGLAQFALLIAEFRILVSTLDRVAQRLESDPSSFIFGGAPPAEVETKE